MDDNEPWLGAFQAGRRGLGPLAPAASFHAQTFVGEPAIYS